LDVTPPRPYRALEVETSAAAVGSKRRRGEREKEEEEPSEPTAGQVMAEMVDVFRK
jgi:hypothetical protein